MYAIQEREYHLVMECRGKIDVEGVILDREAVAAGITGEDTHKFKDERL